MIDIRNLEKTYKTGKIEFRALKGVSFHIKRGEYLAIMGPSGSGKSTLLHLLGYLDSPDKGTYTMNGTETSHMTDDEYAEWRKKKIGFIFQQFHLLPRLSVAENVALPLVYTGVKKDNANRTLALLESVGLKEKAPNLPNELSGGERQRVAVARSLINDPEIILADEPTGNLDTRTQNEILQLFEELHKQGRTIIIVTHDEDVAAHANRVIKIRDGLIVEDRKRKGSSADVVVKVPEKDPEEKSKNIEFLDFIKQAFHSIMGNKMRSFLSMLGILIGVGAVITMLALGEGARESIAKSLSSLGSNLLMVMPGAARTAGVSMDAGTVTRLTLQDIEALKKIPDILAVSGNVNGHAQIVAGSKNWSTSVQGAGPSYADIHSANPQYGRFFTETDNKSRKEVALLGTTVARSLFGDADPLGQKIRINQKIFTVIGVLPTRGAAGFRDQDDVVVIPLNTAMHRLMGKIYVDSIDVQVKDFKLMDAAQDEIKAVLLKSHKTASPDQPGFQIRNMADIQKTLQDTTNAMTTLLGFIAAISLIVGGIGIMNIMLVSVTERIREIGLRKAIGAKRKDIMTQFLIEAVLLTSMGGLAGVLLGAFSSLLLSWIVHWTTVVSFYSVLISLIFSAGVGMVFGILPARKASELNPIDALRYE